VQRLPKRAILVLDAMQRIQLKPDNLDQENRRFDQRPLAQPLFLNSVPKAGSHLLRNIVRMFVPVPQQYQRDFIQHATLAAHLAAFDRRANLLSWGHLPYSDAAAIELAHVRKILIVRDPYSWVLARARFFLSDEFTGSLDYLKGGTVSIDQLINLMIFGIVGKAPNLSETFAHHAVAWLGTDIHLIRYEELVSALKDLESRDAESYFESLFQASGIERPEDWRERIRIGSDPARSGTARENLSIGQLPFPAELTETQRRLVDYAAPGLRSILGYE
jgi:hypothetical protein